MKSAKNMILLFGLIFLAGLVTIYFRKDYSVEGNVLSNANWYSVIPVDE